MASQSERPKPARGINQIPPATVFAGWLALFLIAWLAFAGFGFGIPEATIAGARVGKLALAAMILSLFGWIPVLRSGYRLFAKPAPEPSEGN